MEINELFDLLNTRSPWKRLEALESSKHFSRPVALTVARACLTDGHSAVRTIAADIIGQIGSSRDCHRLLTASRDTSWKVRSSVVDALAYLRVTASAKRIATMLLTDSHPVVRRDAASALVQVSASAEPTLRESLVKERSAIVKTSLYEALYMLGDRTVLNSIILFFKSGDDLVRSNAINGLRLVRINADDREQVVGAIDALIITEPNPGIKGDALALRAIL